MAWTSITGIDQRGRWRLREADDGRTQVELRLCYSPGGLLGMRRGPARPRRWWRRTLEESLKNWRSSWTTRRSGNEVSDEERQEPAGPGGPRARHREDAGRGRPDPADAAGPALGRAATRCSTGAAARRPARSRSRERYPERDEIIDELGQLTYTRSTRARTRSPTRWPTTASARATASASCAATTAASSRRRSRRRSSARRALPEHRVRGPAADRGRPAREAEGADLRRGVLRAARGGRQAPQALRGLARLAEPATTRRSRS